MTDEVYIKPKNNRWAGNVLADKCFHRVYKNVRYKWRIIKIVEIRFFCVKKVLNHGCWPRDAKLFQNLLM